VKIQETYSHLNGLEYLMVHKPHLWKEIQDVVRLVDAEKCKTKVSKEKTIKGDRLYSPIEMNVNFARLLQGKRQWKESRVSYWVTSDEKLIRKTLALPPEEQKKRASRRASSPSSVIIRLTSSRSAWRLKFSSVNTRLWLTTFLSSTWRSTWGTKSMSAWKFSR
jgi:hypothetical protein